MQVLSAQELDQFRVIAASARREGWLNPDSELVVERSGRSVRVAAIRQRSVIEKTYDWDGRWLFQLIRDLAWGTYRNAE